MVTFNSNFQISGIIDSVVAIQLFPDGQLHSRPSAMITEHLLPLSAVRRILSTEKGRRQAANIYIYWLI